MTTIERKSRCSSTEVSCEELVSNTQTATPDPRVKTSTTAPPTLPESYGRESSALAAQAAQSKPTPSPIVSPADCPKLPDSVLDHQAGALRLRLGRPVDYADRSRDAAELKNVESELQSREAVKQEAAQRAHGGVMICKRIADLPGKDVHGAEHWWLQTTRKSVGMGPTEGSLPGHGESLPKSWDTKFLDHSEEKPTSCTPVTKPVDEDCVDRELQVGAPTGKWIPVVNDCHTVVTRVVDKCHQELIDKALEAAAAARPGNGMVPAR